MFKKEEKNKVGRPKLADTATKKSTEYILATSGNVSVTK